MIIDRDEQGTTMLYHQAGHLPFDVVGAYPVEALDVDLVILDHMAQDRRVPEPHRIVMPVLPKRSQYAAFQDALQNALDQGKHIITVVIDGYFRRTDERRVTLALKNEGALEIRASRVFGRADSEYRTIFDPKLDRAYRISERRAEFLAILSVVMESD